MRKLFCLTFFSLAFFVTPLQSATPAIRSSSFVENTKEKRLNHILSQITSTDQKNLSSLFEQWICDEAVGYTLHGDKPMTWVFFDSRSEPLWESYGYLFKSSKFIFHRFKHPSRDHIYNSLLIINRESFLAIVKQNIDLFCELFGETTTPQFVLDLFEENEMHPQNILKQREDLFGILLGFGRANSIAFERKSILSYSDGITKIIPPFAPILPSKGFRSLAEEIAFLNENLLLFSPTPCEKDNPPYMVAYIINYPAFVALQDNPETKLLEKKYYDQKMLIQSLYFNGRFLEVALSATLADD